MDSPRALDLGFLLHFSFCPSLSVTSSIPLASNTISILITPKCYSQHGLPQMYLPIWHLNWVSKWYLNSNMMRTTFIFYSLLTSPLCFYSLGSISVSGTTTFCSRQKSGIIFVFFISLTPVLIPQQGLPSLLQSLFWILPLPSSSLPP